MPRGHALDRDFVAALRLLDAVDLPYAEVWRKLAPVAGQLRRPRPSYATVRLFLVFERRRKLMRMAILDAYIDHLFGVRSIWAVAEAIVEYNTSGRYAGTRVRAP